MNEKNRPMQYKLYRGQLGQDFFKETEEAGEAMRFLREAVAEAERESMRDGQHRCIRIELLPQE